MTPGPYLDGLSLALSQISYLISDLTKKNYKNNVTELKNVRQLRYTSMVYRFLSLHTIKTYKTSFSSNLHNYVMKELILLEINFYEPLKTQ